MIRLSSVNGEPMGLLNRMRMQGSTPDEYSYSYALSACVQFGMLPEGKQIHGRVVCEGFAANVVIGTSLVNLYASCWLEPGDDFMCARNVFDELSERNVVTWNSLLAGYVRLGDINGAMAVFDEMPQRTVISWTTMISGSCYSLHLLDNHSCVENSMHHHCPICYEFLFDSVMETVVMKCGHTMHYGCYCEMIKRDKFCCPICSKSILDMSKTWKMIDEEIDATIMPEDYHHKKVWILCNDCNDTTEAYFHILGQKCSHCRSYNTRMIAPPVLPH